jgi:hypothetical protein
MIFDQAVEWNFWRSLGFTTTEGCSRHDNLALLGLKTFVSEMDPRYFYAPHTTHNPTQKFSNFKPRSSRSLLLVLSVLCYYSPCL